jgi:hypothetical protein
MNRKILLILLFSLSALIVSFASTSTACGSGNSLRPDIKNISCPEDNSSFKLCGDPIDTPVYPGLISYTS